MTTPQDILYSLRSQLQDILDLLAPKNDEEQNEVDIYEMVRSIEIEVSEFNDRVVSLEDKMDLIIKLLSK